MGQGGGEGGGGEGDDDRKESELGSELVEERVSDGEGQVGRGGADGKVPSSWDRVVAADGDRESGNHKLPSWVRFSQVSAVRRLIEVWVRKEVFCLSSIKRAMRSFVGLREGGIVDTFVKPDGNDVRSMFRADMFESGAEELP